MKVELLSRSTNPYAGVICQFLTHQLPKVFKPNKNTLLEILTDLLVGTKENRYGPIPPPENLVVIRDVIRYAIDHSLPIPILIPWGGIKGNKTGNVDIAEVGAIMQIINLDNAVKEFYPMGLKVNIRVEDTGAYWLYRDHNVDEQIEEYTGNFTALTRLLTGGRGILAIPESAFMIDQDEYNDVSLRYSGLILRYLEERILNPGTPYQSLGSWEDLQTVGWKGEIPQEQQDYYTDRYEMLEPGMSGNHYRKMLADYLGGAKARYDLGGRAEPAEKYIQITFVPPVPGAPTGLFNNSLYWRTLSLSNARSHIAPWRAMGYLQITDNVVKMKVTNFGNPILENLLPETITLSENGMEVKISAYYNID